MISMLKKIDSTVFGGLFFRIFRLFVPGVEQKLTKYLGENSEYSIISYYQKNSSSVLSQLCDAYGSDKGEIGNVGHPYPWPSHTYADYYSRLFDHCRYDVTKVFECGLGTNNPDLDSSMGINGKPGASLRVWRDYFPNALIVGADIDKDILFEEERIKTYYVDQTDSSSIKKLWENVCESDFQFMIDDGLHTFDAGVCLFENSVSMLAKGGIYIIEDVIPDDLIKFHVYFKGKDYQVDFVNLYRNHVGLGDNNLIVIRKL